MLDIHHIGSTSIHSIVAKPVIDLLGVAKNVEVLGTLATAFETLGYASHGEYGLVGRRYFTRSDPETGDRLVQLHFYAAGDPAIRRHLSFRDYLRGHPDVALEYQSEKCRCAALHPFDSHQYTDCKSEWIKNVEAMALAAFSTTSDS